MIFALTFRVLKNDQPNAPIDFHTLPPALKDAITKIPHILEENRSFNCIYSSKEVLQILSKEGKFIYVINQSLADKMSSPAKSFPSSAVRHQAAAASMVAPVKVTLKHSQSPIGGASGSGSVYSVTAVEPLKLSIKRAPVLAPAQDTSKKSRVKRRSKNSSIGTSNSLPIQPNPGNQNWVKLLPPQFFMLHHVIAVNCKLACTY